MLELVPNLIHEVGKVLDEEGKEFCLRHAELTGAYIAVCAQGAEERGKAMAAEVSRMQGEGGI